MRILLVPAVLLGAFVAAACKGEEGEHGNLQVETGHAEAGEPSDVRGHSEYWDESGAVHVEVGLALDKAAYVHGVDDSVTVYGAGFIRGEFVLPQIQGANPRGFTAKGANADANGAFSTTIELKTGGNRVQPGVYTIRVMGGEGSVATIPVVVVSAK